MTDGAWDAFVEGNPLAGPFHHSSWASVLVDSYGYQPRYYVLERRGEIVAGLPAMLVRSRITGSRLVALPFTDYCPPLIGTGQDGNLLLRSVLDDAQALGASRVEVRGWPDGLRQESDLVPCPGYVRHVIDLRGGLQPVRERLSENAKRSLKKAAQLGVMTRLAESDQDFETFLSLNLRLRRKHRMLPQPRRFFEAIWQKQVGSGRGYILMAEVDGRPLAALLCLQKDDITLDKFAVNDERLNHYRGSHAAMWAVIEREVERGAHWYDMGRSDARAAGLHRYKSQWGAEIRDATYYFHPSPAGSSTGDPTGFRRVILGTFSRLAPDPVFKAAGSLLYGHLG